VTKRIRVWKKHFSVDSRPASCMTSLARKLWESTKQHGLMSKHLWWRDSYLTPGILIHTVHLVWRYRDKCRRRTVALAQLADFRTEYFLGILFRMLHAVAHHSEVARWYVWDFIHNDDLALCYTVPLPLGVRELLHSFCFRGFLISVASWSLLLATFIILVSSCECTIDATNRTWFD
jgi:hypothetical protein